MLVFWRVIQICWKHTQCQWHMQGFLGSDTPQWPRIPGIPGSRQDDMKHFFLGNPQLYKPSICDWTGGSCFKEVPTYFCWFAELLPVQKSCQDTAGSMKSLADSWYDILGSWNPLEEIPTYPTLAGLGMGPAVPNLLTPSKITSWEKINTVWLDVKPQVMFFSNSNRKSPPIIPVLAPT